MNEVFERVAKGAWDLYRERDGRIPEWESAEESGRRQWRDELATVAQGIEFPGATFVQSCMVKAIGSAFPRRQAAAQPRFNLEHEEWNGRQLVVLRRKDRTAQFIHCPFCGGSHECYGRDDGRISLHCDPHNPTIPNEITATDGTVLRRFSGAILKTGERVRATA